MAWRSNMSRSIRELRIHLGASQESGSSHLRSWVQSNYHIIKQLNPSLPVLVREANDISPVVYARYDFGQERSFDLSGLNESQIDERIRALTAFGDSFPRLNNPVSRSDDIVSATDRKQWHFRSDYH